MTLALSTALALSALAGVWAAYDRGAAWAKFGLIAAGLLAAAAIAWAGRRWGERALGPAGVGCALLAAAVGGYFLLAYDWGGNGAGKFAVLQEAGLWLQAHRPPVRLPEDINGNVAGAALAVLIPLGTAGAVWAWRRPPLRAAGREQGGLPQGRPAGPEPAGRREPAPGRSSRRFGAFIAFITALALILSLAALLLTASRGAWIGLAAGGAAALVLGRAGRGSASRRARLARILPWAAVGALALAAAGLFGAAVTVPGLDRWLGGVAGRGAASSAAASSMGGIGSSALGRAALWRDGLALAGDYPFTGAGLGSTMMVYSTYALLLHVGYITHSHNLVLQTALEQGLPGAAAFLGLLGLALWTAVRDSIAGAPGGSARVWPIAAAASLVALTVHGVADTGLYASKVLPLMFLPFGFAFAGTGGGAAARSRAAGPTAGHVPAAAAAAAAAGALILALLPATRAAFQANLGAVAQTRAELAVYRWPETPIQDALRRSPDVDLAPAIARFRAALALNPGSAAANRRLGQIELSRGEYAAARDHLAAAYAAAPGQRATRQLLGETYAIAGEIARAAEIWRTVNLGDGQLLLRVWWYDDIGEPEMARRIAAAGQEAGW